MIVDQTIIDNGLMWIVLCPLYLNGAAVKEMRSRGVLFCSGLVCSVHCLNLQTAPTPIADTLSLNLLLSLTVEEITSYQCVARDVGESESIDTYHSIVL